MDIFVKTAGELIQAAGQGYYPCLFRVITGLYCPGCGGTRAVIALFHGKFLLSFLLHPLVLYLAVTVPTVLICWFWCRKKRKTFPRKLWRNVLFAGIGLIIINLLLKNYILLFCDTDVLSYLQTKAGL